MPSIPAATAARTCSLTRSVVISIAPATTGTLPAVSSIAILITSARRLSVR